MKTIRGQHVRQAKLTAAVKSGSRKVPKNTAAAVQYNPSSVRGPGLGKDFALLKRRMEREQEEHDSQEQLEDLDHESQVMRQKHRHVQQDSDNEISGHGFTFLFKRSVKYPDIRQYMHAVDVQGLLTDSQGGSMNDKLDRLSPHLNTISFKHIDRRRIAEQGMDEIRYSVKLNN